MKKFNLPHLDAAENVFFQRQLERIEPAMYEVQYAERKARQLVPTGELIPDGIEVVTVRSMDRRGTAKRIANAADDLTQVNVFANEYSAKLWDYGVAFGYTKAELKAAQIGAMPLDSMRARAAREAIADKVDELVAVGDSDVGNEGLLTLSNTHDVTSDLTGSWEAADSDEILADLNAIIHKIPDESKDVEKAKRLILPTKLLRLISKRARSSTSDTTILEYFKSNNTGLEVMDWERANGAGATGKHRIVAYDPNPTKIRFLMSVEMEMQEPQLVNFSYKVNLRMRAGGVALYLPKSVCYGDVAL